MGFGPQTCLHSFQTLRCARKSMKGLLMYTSEQQKMLTFCDSVILWPLNYLFCMDSPHNSSQNCKNSVVVFQITENKFLKCTPTCCQQLCHTASHKVLLWSCLGDGSILPSPAPGAQHYALLTPASPFAETPQIHCILYGKSDQSSGHFLRHLACCSSYHAISMCVFTAITTTL